MLASDISFHYQLLGVSCILGGAISVDRRYFFKKSYREHTKGQEQGVWMGLVRLLKSR